MKKHSPSKIFSFMASSYIIWFVFLIFSIFLGQYLFRLQDNFLLGGKTNHLVNPLFWSWGNFDGEHYLAIARSGYKPLTHFYFPVYPLLIKTLANLFTDSSLNYYLSSLLISHISFFSSLVLLIKLLKIDYKSSFIKQTILLLLTYPFSFFFVSSYTESLFLFLCLLGFYFARKNNFLVASVVAGILSAVRITGLAMFPALIIEWYLQDKKSRKFWQLFFLPLSVFGLLIYLYYLRTATGDALVFLNTVELFGAQRSSTFILLPQVFYRYIVKIIPSLTLYFPALFITFWEFTIALVGLVLLIIGFFKIRASYWIYAFLAYLIPTLSGSFSSLPRYVIIIFPLFILSVNLLNSLTRKFKIAIYIILVINLLIALGLFSNGYFVS